MSWGFNSEKEVDITFALEYKSAFIDMLTHHVRKENQEQFLLDILKATNKNASSTVWGTVWELLKEQFNYQDRDLRDLLK